MLPIITRQQQSFYHLFTNNLSLKTNLVDGLVDEIALTTVVALLGLGEILEDSGRRYKRKYFRVHNIMKEEKLVNERMNMKIRDYE